MSIIEGRYNKQTDGYLLDWLNLDGILKVSIFDHAYEAGTVHEKISIYNMKKRQFVNHDKFVVAFIIPTGLGASIGGHAGDATPTLKMISEVADVVITHPNVVNASDVNEIPSNALYVEGSILSRLLCGNIKLQPVRKNKILTILCTDDKNSEWTKSAIYTVDAARATYGLDCSKIIIMDDLDMGLIMLPSGRASGYINDIYELSNVIDKESSSYDAIAIASIIRSTTQISKQYFNDGECVNPWGGVESLLTHYISSITNLPSAHAPIDYNNNFKMDYCDVVDPRKAVELISTTYFQCVLKGLMRAPRIVQLNNNVKNSIGVEDVDVIVMPYGCIGIPNIAAQIQNIPVIAVKDPLCVELNTKNTFPTIEVNNYCEAAGILAALKSGVSIESIKRPINNVEIEVM